MKNVFKKIAKMLPKKSMLAVAIVTAVVSVAAMAHAWYPNRPTYTIQQPADHVTFNSITNNPNEGDERGFFSAKDAKNTQPGGFSQTVNNLKDGQEVLLRVYVHNNAADNLNGTNFNGKGVAKNTKVRIHLPTASGSALKANAYVSADNAAPKEVADTINLGSSGNFNLTYMSGSAIQYTNAVPTGIKLSDSIVSSGALIGYNKADGVVPGCFKYSSIVTIKVKVHKPSYSVAKSVRFQGQTASDWKESVAAQPGQTVEWRLGFTNTGGTTLNNVILLDQVPAGLTVVPGSIELVNANNPNGYVFPNSVIQANGRQLNMNIGAYNPGSNAYVYFRTTTPQLKDLKCGDNEFKNMVYATPQGLGTVNDDAKVGVKKDSDDCKPEPPVKPSFACDSVSVTAIGDRKVRVAVSTTAMNGAKVTSYLYNFGDGSAPLLTDKNPVEYTYAKDGSYIVRVTVNFDVNGQSKSVTSDKCAASVTFTTPPKPPVTPPTTTPTTPTKLTDTGAGSMVGIFTGTALAGAFAHRKWTLRKSR